MAEGQFPPFSSRGLLPRGYLAGGDQGQNSRNDTFLIFFIELISCV
jgi:hypothetical protein